MTVKQVTIQNVINCGDVIGSAKDWQREPMLASQRFEFFAVSIDIVNIHGKQLEALRTSHRSELLAEHVSDLSRQFADCTIQKFSSTGFPRNAERVLRLSGQVGKRNIWCGYRREQPGLDGCGEHFDLLRGRLIGAGRTRWRCVLNGSIRNLSTIPLQPRFCGWAAGHELPAPGHLASGSTARNGLLPLPGRRRLPCCAAIEIPIRPGACGFVGLNLFPA